MKCQEKPLHVVHVKVYQTRPAASPILGLSTASLIFIIMTIWLTNMLGKPLIACDIMYNINTAFIT